jgi:phage baseplate assembly protein W
MRPDVGSQAESFVFENNSPLTGELLAADIAQLVARYEPRVVLLSVVPRQGTGDEESHLILDITYINRSTGEVVSRTLSLLSPEGS